MDDLIQPWDRLSELIAQKKSDPVIQFIDALSPSETARVISRLTETDQTHLFNLLSPQDAADIIIDIPDTQAADLVEEMSSEQAAAILEELSSDHLADVLGEMDDSASQAVLEKMDKEEAIEARMFLEYAKDCAGGLMVSEFLAYKTDNTIQDVFDDLQTHQEEYKDYHILYFYVVDSDEKLVGVLRMHDLLFPPKNTELSQIMISSPLSVHHKSSLRELENFFDEHHLFGVPALDDEKRLVGVILSMDVEEAINKKKTKTFLRISGVIGGEEFRTMPLVSRSGRRLAWLSMNIVLNPIAASVIAVHQETLAGAITLAVFLPMVSDMSGFFFVLNFAAALMPKLAGI